MIPKGTSYRDGNRVVGWVTRTRRVWNVEKLIQDHGSAVADFLMVKGRAVDDLVAFLNGNVEEYSTEEQVEDFKV